jgi:hypothetical protein
MNFADAGELFIDLPASMLAPYSFTCRFAASIQFNRRYDSCQLAIGPRRRSGTTLFIGSMSGVTLPHNGDCCRFKPGTDRHWR